MEVKQAGLGVPIAVLVLAVFLVGLQNGISWDREAWSLSKGYLVSAITARRKCPMFSYVGNLATDSCRRPMELQMPCAQQSSTSSYHGSPSENVKISTSSQASSSYPYDQLFIVRFLEYRPAAEHLSSLAATLKQSGWEWVHRSNPAARFPTDFGLIRAQNADLATVQVRPSGCAAHGCEIGSAF